MISPNSTPHRQHITYTVDYNSPQYYISRHSAINKKF